MLTLTIRTDKPEAEIGLFDGDKKIAYMEWPAHRQLAESIHLKIKELLDSNGKRLKDLEAVIIYKGPGSFTGLRIGLSVANTLAKNLGIPITATTNEEDWIETGISRLEADQDDVLALPDYGAPPHITQPKH